MVETYIREQDPLKQGLKPYTVPSMSFFEKIREQDPLKQGLKLRAVNGIFFIAVHSRARSTKTRIETTIITTSN